MSASGHNRLTALAAEIRALHNGIRRNAEQIARDALEAGRQLIEAKALLPHGQWEPWLRDHVAISPRSARLYMQLARSGAEIGTVADLGLKAAARMIAGDEGGEKPPSLPTWPALPLCLGDPPQRGEALRIVQTQPWRPAWAFVWPSPEHAGFYEVVAFDCDEAIAETFRRPIRWIGIDAALRHLGIHLADDGEVERFEARADELTYVRRMIAGDAP